VSACVVCCVLCVVCCVCSMWFHVRCVLLILYLCVHVCLRVWCCDVCMMLLRCYNHSNFMLSDPSRSSRKDTAVLAPAASPKIAAAVVVAGTSRTAPPQEEAVAIPPTYETKEERQAVFRELLIEKSVHSSWPWDKVCSAFLH